MKNLFKKGMASVLATAIAMSAMVFSASAELAISGEKTVVAGKTLSLTVSGKTGNLTVASSDTKVATATVSDTTVTVTAVAGGTAKITVTDSGAKADDKTDDVTKDYEITVTPGTLDVYTDSEKKTAASESKGVVAFVNGYKQKTPVVDYKTANLYLGGAAKGKYVVALSTKKDVPAVTNGKPAVDTAAADIAKASIKNTTVSVAAAKKSGTVYAFVFDIKDGKVVAQSGPALVTVKGAANIVGVYSPSDVTDNVPKEGAKPVKTGVVPSSGTATFNVYGSVKADGVTIADNTYTISIPEKSKSLIKLVKDEKDVDSLTINGNGTFTVKAAALKPDGKGKVKTASASVEVMNTQSGKKTSLKLVIVNSTSAVKTNTIKDGYAKIIDEKGDVTKVDVQFTLNDDTIATTDKITVAVLGEKAKFDGKGGKQTVKGSKNYSAKLQQLGAPKDATFRARITAKANAKNDATETAYVYVITTDAAKNVTYYEVATISAKTGAISKIDTPVVYRNGVKVVAP